MEKGIIPSFAVIGVAAAIIVPLAYGAYPSRKVCLHDKPKH
jgi:hypothetical protein